MISSDINPSASVTQFVILEWFYRGSLLDGKIDSRLVSTEMTLLGIYVQILPLSCIVVMMKKIHRIQIVIAFVYQKSRIPAGTRL